MIIIGAGGHGRVIAGIIHSCYVEDIIFWDDDPNAAVEGYVVEPRNDSTTDKVIIGIGNNAIRKRINNTSNFTYGNAFHPRSLVDGYVNIGEGTVIMAGAILNTGFIIGRHVIINTGSILDHDAAIEDYVHISPGAVLTGTVTVKEGAWVGAGAIIIPNITIGKWATVGAGSVVLQDVPDYAVVVGNPARIIKYNQPEF